MKHGRIALCVSLACALSLVLGPAAALAGRSHGRAVGGAVAHGRPSGFHHGGGIHRGGGFHHVAPRPHHGGPRHFGLRPFVHRVVPFGVIAATVVYAPPLAYGAYGPGPYDPPVSYPPPVSYGPGLGYAIAPAPSPPPLPTVVEYETGRYELRGDGMTTPYTWVWIPNPPPPPPTAPPSPAPEPGDPSASSRRQLYRWTDEEGVAHWTDRRETVPEAYRAEAQQPRLR